MLTNWKECDTLNTVKENERQVNKMDTFGIAGIMVVAVLMLIPLKSFLKG